MSFSKIANNAIMKNVAFRLILGCYINVNDDEKDFIAV